MKDTLPKNREVMLTREQSRKGLTDLGLYEIEKKLTIVLERESLRLDSIVRYQTVQIMGLQQRERNLELVVANEKISKLDFKTKYEQSEKLRKRESRKGWLKAGGGTIGGVILGIVIKSIFKI